MQKIITVILVLPLISCMPINLKFEPRELPNACLNKPYKETIELAEVGVNYFNAKISDNNFKFLPKEKIYSYTDENNKPIYKENYTQATLVGTPTSLEPIMIDIEFDVYKSMSIYSPNGYKQSYKIIVQENCEK